MKITRNKLKVVLIVSLCLLVCLGIYKTGIFRKKGTSDPITLNVSLYKSLPHYDSFQTTVEECWNEKHPDVKLNFFDWDCYSGILPENLDVFVLDSITLDSFSQKGCLLALSEEDIQDFDDLIPPFAEGCLDRDLRQLPDAHCAFSVPFECNYHAELRCYGYSCQSAALLWHPAGT